MPDYTASKPVNILRGIVPTATSWFNSIGSAFQFKNTGAAFSDFTTAANNGTANDVTFFPATPSVGAQDIFYFGDGASSPRTFSFVRINLGTSGTVGVVVWEYWNGSAWTTLTVTDLTVGFTATPGTYLVSFTPPSDWATTTVNTVLTYWIRARTTTNFTINPLGTQIWLDGSPQSLSNVTDGNMSTSSTTGTAVTAGSGVFGNIDFDLGSSKTVLFGARLGLFSNTGTITCLFRSSDDGTNFRNDDSSNQSRTGVTETVGDGRASILTGRYIRIQFFVGAAATANAKIYEAYAYELAL